ncbi:hypothetical protein F5B20DRAFT_593953 [Whalleya microplaca]|nr:hypothetical protein F5B20DRAFT_593953 [Whalleya microplaca]
MDIETPMPSPTSSSTLSSRVIPVIKSHFAEHNDDIATCLHIAAPHGAGKSTQLVPEVWRFVCDTWPECKGAYLQSTEYQASSLHKVLEDNEETRGCSSRGYDPADSRLALLTYAEAIDGLIFELPSDRVLFVDIEDVPTLEGELLLGRLINSVDARMTNDDGWTSIILLGAGPLSQHVTQAFSQFLELDIEAVDAGIEPGPVDVVELGRDREDKYAPVVEMLQKVFQGSEMPKLEDGGEPGACVVLFGDPASALAGIVDPLQRQLGFSVAHKSFTVDISGRYIREALEDPNPKILCVDPFFPIVLQCTNVVCAVSMGVKCGRVFDAESSQFPWGFMRLSRHELNREMAWVRSASPFPGAKVNYVTMNPVDDPAVLSVRPEEQLYGDLMALALGLAYHWPGTALRDMPVPILARMPAGAFDEAWRRLSAMGCIEPYPSQTERTWRINGLPEDSAYHMIGSPDNPTRSVHLAAMLSYIRVLAKPGLCQLPTLRVLIRMAAIIACDVGSLVPLDLEAIDKMGDAQPSQIVGLIRDDCAGIGKQQAHNGSLWLALGLWQERKDALGSFSVVSTGSMGRGCRTVRLHNVLSHEVDGRVENMERDLAILPCSDEIKDTQLTEDGLDVVNSVLVNSWIHQSVLFPYATDRPPVDLISLQPVYLDEPATVFLDWKPRQMERKELGRGGFIAIYCSVSKKNALIPGDLTYMPNSALRGIRNRLGPSLSAALHTTYMTNVE